MFQVHIWMVLLSTLLLVTQGLQNGDVRLNHNDNGEHAEDHGVLEIFLNSVWVVVCFDDYFNNEAASAACRQLGYCDSSSYRMAKNFDSPDNRYISGVQCSSESKENAQLHLLRCSYGKVTNQKCTPVFLNCDADCLLKDIRYNGQIYLEHSNGVEPSAGVLKMYLDGEYMPVCSSGVTQQALNSACRQIGYTNALLSSEISAIPSLSWNVSTDKCISTSYQCLSDCFQHSNRYSVLRCHYLNISCTFNETLKNKESAGSENMCSLGKDFHDDSSQDDVIVIVIATAFSITFIFVIVVSILLSFYCYKVHCRDDYHRADDDGSEEDDQDEDGDNNQDDDNHDGED